MVDPSTVNALIAAIGGIIGAAIGAVITPIIYRIIERIMDHYFPRQDGESQPTRRGRRRRRRAIGVGFIVIGGLGLVGFIGGFLVSDQVEELFFRGEIPPEPCIAINESTSPEPIVPNPQPSPPYDVTFEDDFSDKSGGWPPEGESDSGFFRYAGGGYLLNACQQYGGTQARAVNAGNPRDVIVG